MARNQRKYNTEYKVQAVKLSNEIGSSKAAVELGIPVDTLYGWVKAVKEGRLDIGGGAHTPQTAMSLAEELNTLLHLRNDLLQIFFLQIEFRQFCLAI